MGEYLHYVYVFSAERTTDGPRVWLRKVIQPATFLQSAQQIPTFKQY